MPPIGRAEPEAEPRRLMEPTLQDPQAWLRAVLHTDGKRRVGLGVLVEGRHLVTCAHVVAAALDLPENHPGAPVARLCVESLKSRQRRSGRVVIWHPADPEFRNPYQNICLIELDEPEASFATWDHLLAHGPRAGRNVR